MKIYSLYDLPSKEGITFTEPTMAQQHFKDECDINTIMRKYKATGVLPTVNGFSYGDVSEDMDYRTAMEFLLNAQDEFMTLPAEVRRRFDNDPAQLLDFLADSTNKEEAIKLGLISPPVVEFPNVPSGESPAVEPTVSAAGVPAV